MSEESALPAVVRDLAMIGLDGVRGWVAASELRGAPGRLAELNADQARARIERGGVVVLDVRGRSEWDEGHLPDAPAAPVRHIPLGDLPERLGELPRDRPLLVHCQSGSRSAIAVSLLAARGFDSVSNVTGGFQALRSAGTPVQREIELAEASS